MHSTETKNQFIELRAQGWSLSRIATHIGVSKRSLIDWNRECHDEIQELQALETEALHERILASHEQELRRLTGHLTAIENELAQRSPKALNIRELFRMSALIRGQIHDLCAQATHPPSPDLPPNRNLNRNLNHSLSSSVREGRGLSRHSVPATAEEEAKTSPASQPTQAHDQPSVAPKSDEGGSTINHPPIQEHCLECAAPLPKLLRSGERPDPKCKCGALLGAPGKSVREFCPSCGIPVPIHGYNAQRHSNTCAHCQGSLPDLDPKAPFPWLPPSKGQTQ